MSREDERSAFWWSFAWFFFVLLGYYVLRPVREAMGIAGGVEQLEWVFLATFLTMLAAVPLYSRLVARFPRRVLVATMYRIFAVQLLVFWFLFPARGETPNPWVARVFFVWVSVYALFVVTIFWSVLADLFSSEQGRRLFGAIAGGGTVGGFLGSLVVGRLVEWVGLANLLFLPIAALEAAVFCAARARSGATRFEGAGAAARAADSTSTGGGWTSGIVRVFQSPYLLGICAYVFLSTVCGTTIYVQGATIVAATVAAEETRTKLFADIDLAVQAVTFVFQTFVTSRLIEWTGLRVTLALLPVVHFVSFLALGSSSTLGVLVAATIATRSVGYGVAVPTKEVLFTVVSREDKYKAKSFIDTAIYRGGDALASQVMGLYRRLELAIPTIAHLTLPIAAGWAGLAWWLGRAQGRLRTERPAPDLGSRAGAR